MRFLLIASLMFAAALQAQTYTAGTIINDFTAKEIYATGTHVRTLTSTWIGYLGNSDEGHAEDFPIGFSFEYYGQAYTTVDICLNGWVSFSGIAGPYPYLPAAAPANVPDVAYPNGEICVSYHDVFLYGMGSNSPDGLYAQTLGTAPNREFRVEWKTMRCWQGLGPTSVVLSLFETSNRIEIHFAPGTTLPPHATGLENETGTDGVASATGWITAGPQTDAHDFTPLAPGAPEIEIAISGTAVANGAVVALGDSPEGSDVDVVLNVGNVGNAPLLVSAINTAGAVNCTVSVLAGPLPGPVAAGAGADCTLRVSPSGAGPYSFSVALDNDDGDENPYALAFDGTFVAAPGGGSGGAGGASGGGGGGGCSAQGAMNMADLAVLLLVAIPALYFWRRSRRLVARTGRQG